MGLREGTGLEHAAGAELEAEILALIQWSGRIGKIVTQIQTSEEALNHWRDVLARWQTVLPGNPDTQNWTMTEEDGTGTYLANYSRGTNSGKSMLTKSKQRYTVIRCGRTAIGEPSTDVSGSAVIQLNPYPIQIEGHEELAISAPEIGGSVDSSAEYNFRIEAASTSHEVIQGGPDKLRVFQSSSDVGWASMTGATSTATNADIKGTTISEQIQELESLMGQGLDGTTAELKILEKIKALVEHDDATVDAMVERLKNQSGERDENLDAALTGMLGAAGTSKAQKALLELASSAAWPKEVREKALFSFAQVTAPIGEVDQALTELHKQKDDLSNTALLSWQRWAIGFVTKTRSALLKSAIP